MANKVKTNKPSKGSKGNKRGKKRAQGQGLGDLIERFKVFLEESKVEMRKVAYPSQKQTLATCSSVLVLVIIVALYLGIVDIVLSKIIKLILS